MIYFDTEKQAYAQKETIAKFNKIYLTECTDDVYQELQEGKKIWNDNEIIVNPDYEAVQKQKERERLDNLSMTRGDVFEALILAKGLGKAQIRAMIEQSELDDVTKALYLNRFDEALEFYRGYPIFDMLGKRKELNITGEMLDKFFDTKDYHYLTTCKLEINATPAEATVTGVGNYPYGDVAHYKVECEGYVAQEGDIEMVENEVLEVVLDEDTGDNNTSRKVI